MTSGRPASARPIAGIGGDLWMNVALVVILAVGATSVIVWAGAQLAAIVFHGGPVSATITDAGTAMVALKANASDPAAAWPDRIAAGLPGPVAYWASTGVVALVVSAAAGAVWWTWTTRWRDHKNPLGVTRTGELATPKDLRHLTVNQPQPGRITLGTMNRRLLATEPQTSLAVIGPTGCGKTAGFAIPAMLEWEGPIIATSVKNDLLDATLKHRRARGRVWIFDPTAITGHTPSTWTPLDGCNTWAGAQRISNWLCEAAQPRRDSVTDGDYWYTQARKGLAPHLHAAALGARTMADVVRWIDTQDAEDIETILRDNAGVEGCIKALLLSEEAAVLRRRYTSTAEEQVTSEMRAEHAGDPADDWSHLDDHKKWPKERRGEFGERVSRQLDTDVSAEFVDRAMTELAPTGLLDPLLSVRALWGKEARLRGSIYATIENVLTGYADPTVATNTRACEIDLDEWLQGNNTIYIIATAHEQARLRPILTVLLQQAIRTAYNTATANGGTLPHPCLAMLDEAGNIAPLQDLPGYAATARSHSISLVTIWQDLAQIKAIYGDRAQTVLNNHKAKLFGTGIADDTTLNYISRLIGDQQITEYSRSGDIQGHQRNISEHQTWRPTAPADTIRRVPPGHALLLYGRDLPAQIRLRPWWERRDTPV